MKSDVKSGPGFFGRAFRGEGGVVPDGLKAGTIISRAFRTASPVVLAIPAIDAFALVGMMMLAYA